MDTIFQIPSNEGLFHFLNGEELLNSNLFEFSNAPSGFSSSSLGQTDYSSPLIPPFESSSSPAYEGSSSPVYSSPFNMDESSVLDLDTFLALENNLPPFTLSTVESTPIPLSPPIISPKISPTITALPSSGHKRKREEDEKVANLTVDQLKVLEDSLPAREVSDIKKRRRMVRNRNSAQQSRQRKKTQVENLEIEVKEKEQRQKELLHKINKVTANNNTLSEKITALQEQVKSATSLSTIFKTAEQLKQTKLTSAEKDATTFSIVINLLKDVVKTFDR